MRSTLLVAMQLALMAVIALPWEGRGFGFAPAGVVALGAVIGAWALTANRPGNFNIRPESRVGGRIATGGPYRWIRHPMYAALLVACAGFCAGYASPWRWGALVALALVLRAKAGVEEASMSARHSGYADYMRRTRRIVPFLW